MKKSIWFTLAAAGVIAVGGILTAQAAQDNAAGPIARLRQRSWANAKAKLGLTDDQVTQIKTVLRSEKDSLIALAKKQREARVLLREVIKKDGATEADLRAAAANLGAAEGDMAVLKAKLYVRIRPILTQEQLDKIAAWQDKVDSFVDGAIDVFINRMVQ